MHFVGLRCRFPFSSRCPDLGSEGKGGNWYLVSPARWLLRLPAPNTYFPIAPAPSLAYFFQSSRAYCCHNGDREASAVWLLLVWFDAAGTGGAAESTRHTFRRFLLIASSTSLVVEMFVATKKVGGSWFSGWFMVQRRHLWFCGCIPRTHFLGLDILSSLLSL